MKWAWPQNLVFSPNIHGLFFFLSVERHESNNRDPRVQQDAATH